MTKDKIFQDNDPATASFEFDAGVADVFADMINRSVPGYATTLSTIGALAGHYARPDTRCYDLGCSLGAATLAMRQNIAAEGVEIVAIDSSGAMVERCRENVKADAGEVPVNVVEGDILTTPMSKASIIVMNFTLQFVPTQQRQFMIQRIYDALVPGGVLLMSEKVRFEDSQLDQLMDGLHQAFKQSQGYSELEIARKRTALEDVLIADSLTIHRQRLKKVGFNSCECWFQCFNFASIIAIRDA